MDGAEAHIEIIGDTVIKTRLPKTYRHPDLDAKLRKFRTRREAKILQKISIPAPTLISVDDEAMIIEMEHIDGPTVKEALTKENAEHIAAQIGQHLKQLHEQGIIHGDLTTSNMILKSNQVFLIDFGLSDFSEHVEHKAVDLHMLKNSLEATHPDIEVFEKIWKYYQPSKALQERFKQVEQRGRYKHKQ